jgi:hypothetical protein
MTTIPTPGKEEIAMTEFARWFTMSLAMHALSV